MTAGSAHAPSVHVPRGFYAEHGKRWIDVAVAAFALVAVAPLYAGIALAIRLRDGPPVIFRQTRVGRHGEPFEILKFRTMASGDARAEAAFEPGARPRVTALGRRLRRGKLDELPQLLNVLRGEMSLIGPRPEVPSWVARCPERFAVALGVRPGLFDRATLRLRHEERALAAAEDPERLYREVLLPAKLDAAEAYVAELSLGADLRIAAALPRRLLSRR